MKKQKNIESIIINTIKKNTTSLHKKKGLGISDDVAFLNLKYLSKKSKNKKLLITTDSLIENTHFKWNWCHSKDIAKKLIEKNASDILVKGGTPQYAILNIHLNDKTTSLKRVEQFIFSLTKHLKKRNIVLIGGDTAFSQTTSFTMTMLGTSNEFFYRKDSNNSNKKNLIKKNDIIYSVGFFGGCQNALQKLLTNKKIYYNEKKDYCSPEAIWQAPLILKKMNAKVSIDQSDSLYETLMILAKINKLSLNLNSQDILYKKELKTLSKKNRLQVILEGAEDFNLVFIAPSIQKKQLKKINKKFSIKINKIGTVLQTQNKSELFLDNKILSKNQVNYFSHFNSSESNYTLEDVN